MEKEWVETDEVIEEKVTLKDKIIEAIGWVVLWTFLTVLFWAWILCG